jgi:hypothetical protein
MGSRTRREFLKTIPCSALLAADLTLPKLAPEQGLDLIDPRGPIRNPGMKVLIGDNGVQTERYSFPDRIQGHTRWRAKWIWLNSEAAQDQAQGVSEEKPVAACFRKEILLPDTPTQALAWVSAGLRYGLYVNGRLASRGPADAGDYISQSTLKALFEARDPAGHEEHGQWFWVHDRLLNHVPIYAFRPLLPPVADRIHEVARPKMLVHGE